MLYVSVTNLIHSWDQLIHLMRNNILLLHFINDLIDLTSKGEDNQFIWQLNLATRQFLKRENRIKKY